MAYQARFSERWAPAVVILGVAGMMLDFHYGGEVILKIFLETFLFIGQAALTGWLAIAAFFYFALRVLFARRKS